jgi:nucleoside diphosphate kinase
MAGIAQIDSLQTGDKVNLSSVVTKSAASSVKANFDSLVTPELFEISRQLPQIGGLTGLTATLRQIGASLPPNVYGFIAGGLALLGSPVVIKGALIIGAVALLYQGGKAVWEWSKANSAQDKINSAQKMGEFLGQSLAFALPIPTKAFNSSIVTAPRKVEQLLVVLKPNGLAAKDEVVKKFYQELIQLLNSKGDRVVSIGHRFAETNQISSLYAAHPDKNLVEKVASYFNNKPILAIVLEGENICERFNMLKGGRLFNNPFDKSLRNIFYLSADTKQQGLAKDGIDSFVHSSDTGTEALREIKLFFKNLF